MWNPLVSAMIPSIRRFNRIQMQLVSFSKLLVLSALLAGCGDEFTGTYEDKLGLTNYEFRGDGQAYISVLGTTVSGEYKLDGDKVLLSSPQGTVVLSRKGQKLFGPMGLELVRRDE